MLAPGATLEASVADRVPAAIRVFDGEGRDLTRLLSAALREASFIRTLASWTRAVGPLPTGTYRVQAVAPDGRRASREVRLTAGAHESVELELGGSGSSDR